MNTTIMVKSLTAGHYRKNIKRKEKEETKDQDNDNTV